MSVINLLLAKERVDLVCDSLISDRDGPFAFDTKADVLATFPALLAVTGSVNSQTRVRHLVRARHWPSLTTLAEGIAASLPGFLRLDRERYGVEQTTTGATVLLAGWAPSI